MQINNIDYIDNNTTSLFKSSGLANSDFKSAFLSVSQQLKDIITKIAANQPLTYKGITVQPGGAAYSLAAGQMTQDASDSTTQIDNIWKAETDAEKQLGQIT